MANTPNINLVKPLGTDKALVSVINDNSDKIDAFAGSVNTNMAKTQDGFAIVVNGNNAPKAISAGQYLFIKNHSTLSAGGYHATANIANGAAITSSNVAADADGVVNGAFSALNSKIANNGNIIYGTNISSSVSIPDGTSSGTECSSITLQAGKWILLACADWTSNGTGFRQIAFASGANPGRNTAVTTQAITSKEVYQQLQQIVSINAETTYKMYAMQNSGSSLNVAPYLYAISIS